MTSPWTPADDATLRASASTMTAEQIAADLGRTKGGVYERAKRLQVRLRAPGKPVSRPRTDHDRRAALLRALKDGPSTTAELAATVGETVRITFAALQRLKAAGAVRRAPMPTPNRSRRYLWSTAE